jgi:hypothetical protein
LLVIYVTSPPLLGWRRVGSRAVFDAVTPSAGARGVLDACERVVAVAGGVEVDAGRAAGAAGVAELAAVPVEREARGADLLPVAQGVAVGRGMLGAARPVACRPAARQAGAESGHEQCSSAIAASRSIRPGRPRPVDLVPLKGTGRGQGTETPRRGTRSGRGGTRCRFPFVQAVVGGTRSGRGQRDRAGTRSGRGRARGTAGSQRATARSGSPVSRSRCRRRRGNRSPAGRTAPYPRSWSPRRYGWSARPAARGTATPSP